jgi:hypothetical protein
MTFTNYLKLIKAACNCLGNLEGMNSKGTNEHKNNFGMSGLELDNRDEHANVYFLKFGDMWLNKSQTRDNCSSAHLYQARRFESSFESMFWFNWFPNKNLKYSKLVLSITFSYIL